MQTYHKDVTIPAKFLNLFHGRRLKLNFSKQAQRACMNDRLDVIAPEPDITIQSKEIREITTNKFGAAVKMVVRQSYNDKFNVTYVLFPEIGVGEALVKTCWLSVKDEVQVPMKREVNVHA